MATTGTQGQQLIALEQISIATTANTVGPYPLTAAPRWVGVPT